MIKLKQPVKGILSYDGIVTQYFNDQTISKELLDFYQSLGLLAHNGIDFSGTRGTPIYAAHDGQVVFAKSTTTTVGKEIKLQGEGFYTLYMHNDELLVSEGEIATEGQIIAKMGNSGSSIAFPMGVHSHFGLYEGDNGNTLNINNGFGGAIDPLPYLLNENMEYIIIEKEQYLYYEPLNIALNVGDEIELAKLQLHGLSGQPIKKDNLPDKCLVYPGTEQNRFRDLLGLS